MSTLRSKIAAWDFDHARESRRVWVDDRWQHRCRCGATFATMQEWEDHRFKEGVRQIEALIRDRIEPFAEFAADIIAYEEEHAAGADTPARLAMARDLIAMLDDRDPCGWQNDPLCPLCGGDA